MSYNHKEEIKIERRGYFMCACVTYIPALASLQFQIRDTVELFHLLLIQMAELNPHLPVTVPLSQITAVVFPW